MATTTPNFGWAVPTSTDLVKDGAVAIETLGDSIDASLVDLKGGTTGQVLAKASGTDMDFSWVTDATGIPATIFDAKGDIIAATAADTASRLAVGADNTVLTADSSTATGLKWAAASGGGTFAAWTPSWTNVTVGNGTVTAQYATVGDLVYVYIKLLWGSTTSQSGDAIFTLPVTGITDLDTIISRAGTAFYIKSAQASMGTIRFLSTTTANFRYFYAATSPDRIRENDISATLPQVSATGDTWFANFSYRKA
jgi:hypothetical protein